MEYKIEVEGIRNCDYADGMTELFLKVICTDKDIKETYKLVDIGEITTTIDQYIADNTAKYIAKMDKLFSDYELCSGQVSKDDGAGNLADVAVTKEEYVQMFDNKLAEIKSREQLIKDKIKQQAIDALIAEGKLNEDGSLKVK